MSHENMRASPRELHVVPRSAGKLRQLEKSDVELHLCLIGKHSIWKNCIENIREIRLWNKTSAKNARRALTAEEKKNRKRLRFSLAVSVSFHTAVMVIMISIMIPAVQNPSPGNSVEIAKIPSGKIFYPISKEEVGGGGGGGEKNPKPPSMGALPKRSPKVQLTPPTVTPKEEPELPVEPSVVVPPEIKIVTPPDLTQLGDPFTDSGKDSSETPDTPSSGPGDGGGIGSGSGGGVGSGIGPGLGPGEGGGTGGGVYQVGSGVSAPVVIYKEEPKYSDEARKKKLQGTVILDLVIDADGKPKDIKVRQSLGLGLDEEAISAVSNWRFRPAMKGGEPVSVYAIVEVTFRLL